MLIKYGADVNLPGKYRTSCLMLASSVGNFELVEVLMENNARQMRTDKFGKSALIHAIINNNLKVVSYLLMKGANYEGHDSSQNYPIHYAAGYGCEEIIDDIINPQNVKKVVICMGNFYYDLLAEREKLERDDVALIRVEQLFPLHEEKIQQVIDRYTNAERYVWAQEEPRNMGAWSFMLQRFTQVRLEVASRKYYAVPAAGSKARFEKRHQQVIKDVFD